MPSALTNLISLYPKPWNIESQDSTPLDIFLENIKDGKWQDVVLKLRTLEGKDYEEAKKKVPSVTISGKFVKREDEAIEKHSGFIGIDVDDVDPEETKSNICPDKYIAAAFTSIGGKGLCLIFHIDGARHREAFQGISEYLFETYKLIVDPTSVNPSRARFISYDPHAYIADRVEKFKIYPKEKPPKKIDKAVFSQDDFEQILKQIVDRQLNITQDSYYTWLRIGFAVAWKFGEGGRTYFHIISQFSAKYDAHIADKQYTACLKHRPTKQESTISTFYYYAKAAGCNLYSERTKIIAYTTISGKKAGLSEEQIAANLEQFEGITEAQDIIEQVYRQDIWLDEDSQMDQVKLWLKQNYNLELNTITRKYEANNVPLETRDLNSIWVRARSIFEKLPRNDLKYIINSDLYPQFNPLHRYFDALKEQSKELKIPDLQAGPHLHSADFIQLLKQHAPLTTALFAAITTKDPDYLLYFGTKWLVGIISAVYGEYSSLVLVLTGEKVNIGKTEWFRRLLPEELHKRGRKYPDYYAESKLDAGKDDWILMTQKLIIMDDEFGGKSKKDAKLFKDLTSKEVFSLREPYGETNVDLPRLAVLCGTCNEQDLLNDPIDNRRIIPIYVTEFDHAAYNKIDKRDLFAEVLALWLAGMKWRLDKEDVAYLGVDKHLFEVVNSEEELINKYYTHGEEQLTATDIKVFLENKTNQKLSLDKIGKLLRKMGFEKQCVRIDGLPRYVWLVREKLQSYGFKPPALPADDVPF